MAGPDRCIVLSTRWEITGRSSEVLDFLRLSATHLRISALMTGRLQRI